VNLQRRFSRYNDGSHPERKQPAFEYEAAAMNKGFHISRSFEADIRMSSTAIAAVLPTCVDHTGSDSSAIPMGDGLPPTAYRAIDTRSCHALLDRGDAPLKAAPDRAQPLRNHIGKQRSDPRVHNEAPLREGCEDRAVARLQRGFSAACGAPQVHVAACGNRPEYRCLGPRQPEAGRRL
jgi:hypothetical protein